MPMGRLLWVALLPSLALTLSGCGTLFVALADAMTPEPVQSVDVLWARTPNFCAAVVHRDGREAYLLQGNVDEAAYEPKAVLALWVPLPSPKDRAHGGRGPDIATAPRLVKSGSTYVYGPAEPLAPEEVDALPPIAGTEGEDFTGAMKQARRSVLYRLRDDRTLRRECVFMSRRMWFNFAT
jgi:hypothetical protein